ncbi:protein-disulfide isomerase [Bosea sp. Tri-44]|uniref:DsbA family protein n=1 Tax=Bosea sp. Tri-44 TaxID=1972137 RepID=UPI00100EFA5E|nr:DsbA family protein [Bosea sp. Tri-44]RXT46294.1 protein-disulfide isomerase [Bosea sp. Tri-44]
MRITYLFDPLCGWCYGAGPMLEQLAGLNDVTIEPAPTGLFAGDGARPMDKGFAAYAWQNDQRIARLTGQVFSDSYREKVLGAVGGTFDSAPATLGIIAVGLVSPQRQLEALKALQQARYVEGHNHAEPAAVAAALDGTGLPEAAQRLRAPDDELLGAYRARIAAARDDMVRAGAQGVPTLLVGEGAQRRTLHSSSLFGSLDTLVAQLRAA